MKKINKMDIVKFLAVAHHQINEFAIVQMVRAIISGMARGTKNL